MFVDNSLKQPFHSKTYDYHRRAIDVGLTINLEAFISRPGCHVLSLTDDNEKQALKNAATDLVFRCFNEDENYFLDSGNYIGHINWPIGGNRSLPISIGSRFSMIFLQRMMNFANDLVVEDIEADTVSKSSENTAEFVLLYLFTQSLEKAFLLGLPKRYQSIQHHEAKLKGALDINRTVRNDWPFKGKISSTSREQFADSSIASVLFKAAQVVKAKQPALIKRIKHIVPALRDAKTDEFVSAALVNQAIQSPALNNPIFLPYRKVLDFAEMLIKLEGLQSNAVSDQSGVSFVLNIAELFEVYVRKLLAFHFPDWTVDSPKIRLYESQFYSRHIIPDIVMRKDNRVAVFDTKYKRMNYQGTSQRGMGDVDRADFFQIHTYMSYYQSQPDIEFIGGGLIYPLAEGYSEADCFSTKVLENNQAWFCVDGIEIPKQFEQQDLDYTSLKNGAVDAQKEMSDQAAMQRLLVSEHAFIERIKSMLKRS